MGQSIACGARVDGRKDRGTALLETEEVIYRGDAARARVPFASMRSIEVRDGWLVIAHGEAGKSLLELELGARAEEWKERIRSPKGLVEKLGVKRGAKVAIVGIVDEALAADLAKLGATVQAGTGGSARSRANGELDLILVRVAEAGELACVKGLVKRLAPEGAIWIVRPKGKEGVAESAVFAAGRGAGLVDVKVAKWSDTDTGLKFVIPKAARIKLAKGSAKGAGRT